MSTRRNDGSAKLFHQLPLEVLTLIVEHLTTEPSTIWRCRTDFPKLKALRLSCRSFSYVPRLLAILFRGVKLVAVPEHLEHLEKADIRKLALYVERLTFFPAFQSWTLGFDAFKEIVLSQAIDQYSYEHEIWDGMGSLVDKEDGHSKFVNQHWAGKLPFSDDELTAGYEKYDMLANKGKDCLESQRLLDLWTSTLKALSNCRQYRIDTQDYKGSARETPGSYGCEIYRHKHSESHGEGICRRAAGTLGDAVFDVAIKCMADAHVQPRVLDLRFKCTGAFDWASLSGWDKLDLSSLDKLRFRPMALCLDELAAFPDATEAQMAAHACTALNGILRKCSGRLKDLEIEADSPLTWPTEDLVPLPELKRLAIDGIDSNTGALSKLLHSSPKLQHFELRGTHELTTGMRELLDAVRGHPSRMTLKWDSVPSNDWTEIGAHFNTAYTSSAKKTKPESASRGDIRVAYATDVDRSLRNYVAGKGRWNKSLRMEFEGGNTDSEDSEDSEEAED